MMQQLQESIWGNINLCLEIAMNVFYIVAEKGEGLMVPKEEAEKIFSQDTLDAGIAEKEFLCYKSGEHMDRAMEELDERNRQMQEENHEMENAGADSYGMMEEVWERPMTAEEDAMYGFEP